MKTRQIVEIVKFVANKKHHTRRAPSKKNHSSIRYGRQFGKDRYEPTHRLSEDEAAVDDSVENKIETTDNKKKKPVAKESSKKGDYVNTEPESPLWSGQSR